MMTKGTMHLSALREQCLSSRILSQRKSSQLAKLPLDPLRLQFKIYLRNLMKKIKPISLQSLIRFLRLRIKVANKTNLRIKFKINIIKVNKPLLQTMGNLKMVNKVNKSVNF